MEPAFSPLIFSVALFLGMLISLAVGYRLGSRRELGKVLGKPDSLGTIEGALFGVFGLLIAFTFTGSAERFGQKRALIAEEVSFTETAYLRLQLVPESERVVSQELFRRYVDSRLETYRRLPDMQAAMGELTVSRKLQKEIWTRAVEAARLPKADLYAGEVLLPAINDMINIATTRTMILRAHPPRIVFELLFVLALICSLLAGFRMSSAEGVYWLHIFAFIVITVSIVYVIIDIEYPRGGLINLQRADQMLAKVREEMN